jgi:hypothetical protein
MGFVESVPVEFDGALHDPDDVRIREDQVVQLARVPRHVEEAHL